MNLFFWRHKGPSIPSEESEERSALKPGQFYCEKCGVPRNFDLHKPFCSAECKFGLAGTANYPAERKPRGKRKDEQSHFYFHVHGIMYRNRQAAISRCFRGEPLRLVREPETPHDRNAIRILRSNREDIGYVPRDNAAKLAPKMDAGQPLRAEVDWSNSPTADSQHFGLKVRVGLMKSRRS